MADDGYSRQAYRAARDRLPAAWHSAAVITYREAIGRGVSAHHHQLRRGTVELIALPALLRE